ncbi:transcriptional regulator [Streptomyces sp. NPDC051662]|uniref:tetratricopeptide repeat protein n=1 Tax=Streptomyces sp. NPDC051662 TaxID=3154750 RepID=UPI0034487D07
MTVDTAAALHPLAYLLWKRGMTNEAYLFRVAEQHRRMGYGQMGYRKEKASRWVSGEHAPTLRTQFAMAALEKISPEAVLAHGWPGWLLLAVPDDHPVFTAPWTTTATVHALEIAGGPVDRRKFLITTSVTLGSTITQWSGAVPAGAATTGGRRIDHSVPDRFERRLDDLRHLDDHMGSGDVYEAARTEVRLITSTLKNASCTEDVRRRLLGAAAEASRSAGWTAYDSGQIAAAERHYVTALRSAASAADPVVGANTLAFWAIQQYSTGNPRGAIDLVEAALTQAPRIGSARMTAMLHARACRAHARAGDARAAARSANAALDTYAHAGAIADDPSCVYWFNLGETYQLLGSSALNLGDPKQALRHFRDASTAHSAEGEAYNGDDFPRGHAIYLARLAEAHLALGDVDAAVDTAHTAVSRMGGVTSARGSSTLDDLRLKLSRRRGVPAVANFLNYTAADH